MTTCVNPKCGKRLMPVRRPDGTWSDRHPTPQCDPRTEWAMSDEELAELAARYWPGPEPPAQEATPT